MNWNHGSFHWNELNSWDAEKDKAFYAQTLGWTYDAMPMGDETYWLAKMGEQYVGGIFPLNEKEFAGVPAHWLSYIAVDDVDRRVEKAVAAGAKLVRAPFDVPDTGRIAIIQEPGGAHVGWMTPVSQAG